MSHGSYEPRQHARATLEEFDSGSRRVGELGGPRVLSGGAVVEPLGRRPRASDDSHSLWASTVLVLGSVPASCCARARGRARAPRPMRSCVPARLRAIAVPPGSINHYTRTQNVTSHKVVTHGQRETGPGAVWLSGRPAYGVADAFAQNAASARVALKAVRPPGG